MSDIAHSTLQALRQQNVPQLFHYDDLLCNACQKSPPLFGETTYADIYHEAACDPQWLAISLITNAEREGDGATRLWSLAASTPDAGLAAQIRQHAIDESHHARAYVQMLDIAFPGAVDRKLHAQLLTLSPGYSRQQAPVAVPGSAFAHPITLDDLIQMNIAEIRTRVHHLMQRPILLQFCPVDSRPRLARILDRLLLDETRHVAYTARLIEGFCTQGEAAQAKALMLERMDDFDAITRHELELRVFE
ncbi:MULTISPECIES: hypothetical protein [Pseudomonas]|uniref:hypothetical protein n=1 Tax=Pseudomonas TaxID=286 RepID=UPI00069E286A|nr:MULTISPECIES: hypothetical protein [Pseudomonas]AZC21378.1 hypothetical protein C4K40_6034 [Pseudomonas sp. CMR5c]MCU7647939.1 hypothetical protein [Pseudomonas piscis]